MARPKIVLTNEDLETVEYVFELSKRMGLPAIRTVRCAETAHLYGETPEEIAATRKACRPFGVEWQDTRPEKARAGLVYERIINTVFRTAVFPDGVPVGATLVKKPKSLENRDEHVVVESRDDISPADMDRLRTIADGGRPRTANERKAALRAAEIRRSNPYANKAHEASIIGEAIRDAISGRPSALGPAVEAVSPEVAAIPVPPPVDMDAAKQAARERMAKARAAKGAKQAGRQVVPVASGPLDGAGV